VLFRDFADPRAVEGVIGELRWGATRPRTADAHTVSIRQKSAHSIISLLYSIRL
jgi:hypothetical protein